MVISHFCNFFPFFCFLHPFWRSLRENWIETICDISFMCSIFCSLSQCMQTVGKGLCYHDLIISILCMTTVNFSQISRLVYISSINTFSHFQIRIHVQSVSGMSWGSMYMYKRLRSLEGRECYLEYILLLVHHPRSPMTSDAIPVVYVLNKVRMFPAQ